MNVNYWVTARERGPGVTAAGPSSHKTDRDREIVHQDFLRAGFIRLIEMFGVSRSSWYGHCSCHFTTANRFLFAGTGWVALGLVTKQPQTRTCHKHFHERVEGHRSMSSWLERILLYWIYIWFWLLFLFQVSFVDHKLNVSAQSSKPTCLHFGLVVRKQVFNKIVFHSNDMKVQNMKY